MLLLDHVRRGGGVLHLFQEGLVDLDDLDENVAEVVLAALLRVVLDRRPYGGRGDGESLADHPFRARVNRVEPHEGHVLVGDPGKYFDHDVGGNLHGLVSVVVQPFGQNGGEAFLLDFRNLAAAAVVVVLAAALHLGGDGVYALPPFVVRQRPPTFELGLVDQELTAFEADDLQDPKNGVYEVHVENGFGVVDMAEIPRSLQVAQPVGGTESAALQRAHPRIEQPPCHRHVVHVGVSARDFHNGSAADRLGGQQPETDPQNGRFSNDRHCAGISLSIYISINVVIDSPNEENKKNERNYSMPVR